MPKNRVLYNNKPWVIRDGPLEKYGGGGDFLRGNIYIFLYSYQRNFFSHLMAGNIFFK